MAKKMQLKAHLKFHQNWNTYNIMQQRVTKYGATIAACLLCIVKCILWGAAVVLQKVHKEN